MKRTAIAWAVLSCFGGEALADDVDRAALLDQIQAQYSLCVAYYTYQKGCGASGETGRRLNAVKRRSEALAGAIAMSEDEVALRMQLALTANGSLAGGCDGLSTLQNRYAVECDSLSHGRE